MNQKTENEILFTREVLCAMIDLSVLDCKLNPDKYMRPHTQNFMRKYQTDAIQFLKSDGFNDICFALGLPADKIRRKAFV